MAQWHISMGPDTINKFINQYVLISFGSKEHIALYSTTAKQVAQTFLLEAEPQPLENLVELILTTIGQNLIALLDEPDELTMDKAQLLLVGSHLVHSIKLVTEHGLQAQG